MKPLTIKQSLILFFLSVTLISCGGSGGGGGVGGGSTGSASSIGGSITGLTGTVVLQNNGAGDLSISANGIYTFDVSASTNENYSITILTQPVGQTCTVTNGVGQATADVGDVVIACTDIDTDGDGLGDNDETNLYGTSPIKTDTDGDGITDFDEIVTFSFDSSLNNFNYNPLIADVPVIEIDIVTAPDIDLDIEYSSGTTDSIATNRGTSNTTAVSTSKTNSNSTVIEVASTQSTDVTISAQTEISMTPSVSFGVEATMGTSYTDTTSNETGFSWTNDQSTENSSLYEQTKAAELSNSYTVLSGGITSGIQISNFGNRAFELTNITLSASMVSNTHNEILELIGNLTYDDSNGLSGFPATSLAGGETIGPLAFSAVGVDAPTIKGLLADSSGMQVGVASYNLLDINGVGFAFALEEVQASTATIIIDYETVAPRPERRYLVSTVADPNTLTVTAQSVMQDILKIGHAVDGNGVLTSIDSVAGDGQTTGWLLMHQTTDSSGVKNATIHSYNTTYDFNSLTLKAGDVLHMVYQIDDDGDFLGRRIEAMLGTDEFSSNSDNDSGALNNDADGFLDDYEEAFLGWVVTYADGSQTRVTSSPMLLDTDGDGFSDVQEFNALTDPRSPDTDSDGLTDDVDPNPLTADYALFANTVTASFTDTSTTTGEVAMTWGHTWSGGFSAGRDIIMRQVSTSAAYTSNPTLPEIAPSGVSQLTAVGDWLACGVVANCWEVVGIQAVSNSDGIGTYSLTDPNLNRVDTYRYAIYSEYNDGLLNYYMFDTVNAPIEATTVGTIKRVTITMAVVTMDANCVDYESESEFQVLNFSNCEPFYSVEYNNTLIASRYSTPLQSNTQYTTTTASGTTGSLTPAYELWSGSTSWADSSNPVNELKAGVVSAYIDVVDTVTSVPLQITVGERDALFSEAIYDPNGADNSRTVVVDVLTNNLLVGTNQTVGTTVSWSNGQGADWSGETGSISFTYLVSVTDAP